MVEEKQSAPATQATDDMPVTEAHDILYRALGIGKEILITYPGPAQREATLEELTLISTTPDGRALRATPQTATSWLELQRAAASASIVIEVTSAFRSIEYQGQLIKRKLEAGELLSDILKVNAIPGFSEHHTGEALDLFSPPQTPLITAFEHTAAFQWLSAHASNFGFFLSYPRGNPSGFNYEPWHWKFNP